jgi:hypothetical protein
MGVRNGALVVLPYGGGFGDGGVEVLPHKLSEVESLLGGINRRVVLGFTRGLGHTGLLFGLVTTIPNGTCTYIPKSTRIRRSPFGVRRRDTLYFCCATRSSRSLPTHSFDHSHPLLG